MAKRTDVIVPTAINVLMFVNDTFIEQRKAGDDLKVYLPTFRKRAKLIVEGQGALQVSRVTSNVPASTYTR